MDIILNKSHSGWHSQWFYIKDHSRAPLPAFSDQPAMVPLRVWEVGPVKKDKEKLAPLLGAIQHLKRRGLTIVGLIGAFHKRRILPRMARDPSLWGMDPAKPYPAITFVVEDVVDSEVQAGVRGAVEDREVVYPILGHTKMMPETGLDSLVSHRCWLSCLCLPLAFCLPWFL